MLFRYRRDRRQVKTDALDTRMFLGDFDTEQSSCAADIAQAVIAREIEFIGERFEVDARRPVIPSRKHSSFSGSAYNSSNIFLPPC